MTSRRTFINFAFIGLVIGLTLGMLDSKAAPKTTCGVFAGGGKTTVNDLTTERINSEALRVRELTVVTGYQGSSNPYRIGGLCGWKYIEMETYYSEGTSAVVTIDGSVRGSFQGRNFDSETYRLVAKAEVRGPGINLIGKLPISNGIDVLLGAGLIYGKASVSLSTPQLPGIEIVHRVEKVIPNVLAGLKYSPRNSRLVATLRYEANHKDVRTTWAHLGFSF